MMYIESGPILVGSVMGFGKAPGHPSWCAAAERPAAQRLGWRWEKRFGTSTAYRSPRKSSAVSSNPFPDDGVVRQETRLIESRIGQ